MKQTSIPYSIEFILRITGIWPGVSHISAYLLIPAVFTFSLTFQFWNAVLVRGDVILLTSSIGPTLAEILFLIKFLAMRKNYWYVTNILREIITDCEEIQTKNEENIILEAERFSRLFFAFTSFLYASTAVFFVTTSAISYTTENREFILESTFPFEAYKSPIFEIIFCIQSFTTVISCLGNAFVDGFFMMMVSHGCAKIDLVRGEIMRFSEIVAPSDEKQIRCSATKNLVEKHKNVIEFMEKIEHIYFYELLLTVILSTVAICAMGFSFITLTEDNSSENVGFIKIMKFLVFFISGLWLSGVYCTGGDFLFNKNELIQRDVYSCSWYKLQPTDCKSLWMVMIRAQKPMIITAGKLINMTLDSYTKILKFCASCLSLLRAVK